MDKPDPESITLAYAFVRWIADLRRDEAINIGVLLASLSTKDSEMQIHLNLDADAPQRLATYLPSAPPLDLPRLCNAMNEHLGQILKVDESLTLDRILVRLTAGGEGRLQFSALGSISFAAPETLHEMTRNRALRFLMRNGVSTSTPPGDPLDVTDDERNAGIDKIAIHIVGPQSTWHRLTSTLDPTDVAWRPEIPLRPTSTTLH